LFKMGLKNLSRRKARTILTVLGVVIGSLSIIIMVSIGNGMSNNFDTQLMQQGGLTIINIYTNANIFDEEGGWIGSKEQTLDDALIEKIKAIDHVRAVTPIINKYVNLTAGKYMGGTNLMAIDYEVLDDFDYPELVFGQYPSEEDITPIVFGANAAWFYDPYVRGRQKDPEIDFQKDKITLKFSEYMTDPKKKQFSLPLKNIAQMVQTQSNFDYNAYIDIGYFKELYMKYCNTLSLEDRKRAVKSIQEYQQVDLNVDNIKNVLEVQEKIEELGFQSQSQMQWLEPMQKTSKTMQMVLGALGAVAMIVSAISIANTMVMSIYERTKEIGIMKVLGCVIRDVRKLFLFEAAMIGLFGGIIGIILGYASSWGINKFGAPIFGALMSGNYMYNMEDAKFSIIPFYLPVFSLGISIAVGLLSGYFPARRATKISAIEAMKTEG
jgi:ABC-type antimicrobial peptide transport system permease subunit